MPDSQSSEQAQDRFASCESGACVATEPRRGVADDDAASLCVNAGVPRVLSRGSLSFLLVDIKKRIIEKYVVWGINMTLIIILLVFESQILEILSEYSLKTHNLCFLTPEITDM